MCTFIIIVYSSMFSAGCFSVIYDINMPRCICKACLPCYSIFLSYVFIIAYNSVTPNFIKITRWRN